MWQPVQHRHQCIPEIVMQHWKFGMHLQAYKQLLCRVRHVAALGPRIRPPSLEIATAAKNTNLTASSYLYWLAQSQSVPIQSHQSTQVGMHFLEYTAVADQSSSYRSAMCPQSMPGLHMKGFIVSKNPAHVHVDSC